jgi:acyl-ACP thioesterase
LRSLDSFAPAAFTPDPARGRVFTTTRVVRATDVTPDGRLRLDAFARYLQEAAEDDVAGTGWQAPYDWVLRRCAVSAGAYPRLGDEVRLRTFCTGVGPRWAERTTTLAGPGGVGGSAGSGGDLMQAAAVWVAVAPSGELAPLGPGFGRFYGEATGGRRVSARLRLPGPAVGDGAGLVWALRASDFDPAGHVNNTVHWAAAEDVLAGREWVPSFAELEYHQPILPGPPPRLVVREGREEVLFWLMGADGRLASGRLAVTAAADP